jgi:hypothetical protein
MNSSNSSPSNTNIDSCINSFGSNNSNTSNNSNSDNSISMLEMTLRMEAAAARCEAALNCAAASTASAVAAKESINNNPVSMSITPGDSSSTIVRHCWGGKLNQVVPADFRFPTGVLKLVYDLWLYGDKRKGIVPLYKLRHKPLPNKSDKTYLCKACKVIHTVMSLAAKKDPSTGITDVYGEADEEVVKKFKCAGEDSDSFFRKGFEELISKLYGSSRTVRAGELSYITLHDQLRECEKNGNKIV